MPSFRVPDPEEHARFLAGGLTRYPYDILLATLNEMDAVEAEYHTLLAQASPILVPHDRYVGDIEYAPESVKRLYQVVSLETPTFCLGNIKHGGRQEAYPVAKWQKQIGTYHHVIGKLKRALAACAEQEGGAACTSK